MKHLLLQATPEQQQQHKSAVMNSVHNALAPALSLPQKKRSRELTAGNSNNKQQLDESATMNGALNALDENSDLIRNGRALFAATTTSLAAPLDIPNKRRRIDPVDQVADAAALPGGLATPKQSSVLLNAVGSKQRLSSRKQDSINKKPASQITAAAARSTFTRETEELRTATDKRTRQEDAVANWSKKYGEAIKGFVFYFDSFEDSKRREGERALRDLGAVRLVHHHCSVVRK